MGREGEVVAELIRASSSGRIPASASRCSSCRGARRTRSCSPRSSATPRPTSPARQHLDPGVRRARRARAARRRRRGFATVDARRLLPGHLGRPTCVDGTLYGVPWYVDTRLLFYRRDLLAQRRLRRDRRRRGRSGDRAMRAVKRAPVPATLRDPPAAQRVRAAARTALQTGDAAAARRRPLWQLPQRGLPPRARRSTSRCSASGFAPAVDATQTSPTSGTSSAAATSRFYITGPWNIGEFKRRLPPATAGRLDDRAAAGPRRARRVDCRRLEPRRVPQRRRTSDAAWQLIEYLSRPDVQRRFHELTGDLPPRRERLARHARSPTTSTRARFATSSSASSRTPQGAGVGADRHRDAAGRRARPRAASSRRHGELDRGRRILEKRRWMLDARADRILDKRRWLARAAKSRAMKRTRRAAWWFVAPALVADRRLLRLAGARRARRSASPTSTSTRLPTSATCASSGCATTAGCSRRRCSGTRSAIRSTSSSSACRCRSRCRSVRRCC